MLAEYFSQEGEFVTLGGLTEISSLLLSSFLVPRYRGAILS